MTIMMSPTTLLSAAQVNIGIKHGISATFTMRQGIVTTLLGGGSQPRQLLYALLCGLRRPDHGQIVVGKHVFFDQAHSVNKPPHERGIGFVPSDPVFWPKWPIVRNIGFFKRYRLSAFADLIHEIQRDMGLENLHRRRPHDLPQEQQWLTGLLRGLVTTQNMLLIESIPAALSPATRHDVFNLINKLTQSDVPILVGCDHAVDALRFGKDIIGISKGVIMPVDDLSDGQWNFGTDGTLDGEPGMIFDGQIKQRDLGYRMNSVNFAGGTIMLPARNAEIGSAVKIRIKSQDVIIAVDHPTDTSISNIFPGHITALSPAADGCRMDITINIGKGNPCLLRTRIFRRMADELHLSVGAPVYALVREASAL